MPKLMRFVPRSVMTGFVNALAIVIFLAQVPYIRDGGGLGLLLIAAALVAVMILVSVSTFDWHSIAPKTLKRMPRSETVVMAVTVVGTVATHNLAIERSPSRIPPPALASDR